MESTNTNTTQHIDAFGPVALANFALHPTGAHIFRAQHEQILRALSRVTGLLEAGFGAGPVGCSQALQASCDMTLVLSMMGIHQSIEDSIIRRTLAAEPRMRLVVEQFEREMAPLMSEMFSFVRRYPSPSSILKSTSEFSNTFSSLLAKLQERFRAEERELLSAFDRAIRVSAPGGALLETA